MNTREVYGKLYGIKGIVEQAVSEMSYGHRRMIDPYQVELEDPTDPEELARHDALFGIIDKLDDVLFELEYWKSPILRDGVMVKNESGRYEVDGFELCSGYRIEILDTPCEEDEPRWRRTRVEHDGEDYYIVAGHQRLDGVRARVR